MGGRPALGVSENFPKNLKGIRDFLVDALFDRVLPNIEEYPEIGFDFLTRQPLSAEGRARRERLVRRVTPGTLREYVFGDYLILYAVRPDGPMLLAIKHHRQLSFDLRGHWSP